MLSQPSLAGVGAGAELGKNINEKDNDLKNLETPENEVTERLMNMMEKFTKRIIELENKLEVMSNEK